MKFGKIQVTINGVLGMATGIDAQIEFAEQRLKELKAQKAKRQARERAKQVKVERVKDTRRKILVGAIVMASVERGEFPKEQMLGMLDLGLTRDNDRALFGLPTKAK